MFSNVQVFTSDVNKTFFKTQTKIIFETETSVSRPKLRLYFYVSGDLRCSQSDKGLHNLILDFYNASQKNFKVNQMDFRLVECICARCQVAMYQEKYDEFQQTLTKSNDAFQNFKNEMDKVMLSLCFCV